MDYEYDVFLSYSGNPDYQAARSTEIFLTRFHRKTSLKLKPLRVCRDGSSFKPNLRGIPDIIKSYLERSQRLLVFCSPPGKMIARDGKPYGHWMNQEIEWFLEMGRENDILLAVTDCQDPGSGLDLVIPDRLLALIWVDLSIGKSRSYDA